MASADNSPCHPRSSSRSSPRQRRLGSLTPLRSPSPPLAPASSSSLPLPRAVADQAASAAAAAAAASSAPNSPSAHTNSVGRRHSQPSLDFDLVPPGSSSNSSFNSTASYQALASASSGPSSYKAVDDRRTSSSSRRVRSHSSTLTPVGSFTFLASDVAPSSASPAGTSGAVGATACSPVSLGRPLQAPATTLGGPVQASSQLLLQHSPQQSSFSLASTPAPLAASPPSTWLPPTSRSSSSANAPGPSSSSGLTSSPPGHYSFGFTPTGPHAPNPVRPKPRSRNSSSTSLTTLARRSTRGTTPPSSSILLPSASPPATFNVAYPTAGLSPPIALSSLGPSPSLSLAAPHGSPRLSQLTPHYPQYHPHQPTTYAAPVARTNSLPSIYPFPLGFSPVSQPLPLRSATTHMDGPQHADLLGLHDQEIPDEAPPSYDGPPLASSASHPNLGVAHPFYSQSPAALDLAIHHQQERERVQHHHGRHASEGRQGMRSSQPTPSHSRRNSFDGYSDASETEGERGGLKFTTSSSSGSRRRNRVDLSSAGRARPGGGMSSSSSVGASGSGNSALGLVGLGRQGADGLGRGEGALRPRRPLLDTAESGLDINILSTDGEEPLPTSLLRPPPRPPSRLAQLIESLPLIMALRLLSAVPATIGTAYLIGRALGGVGVEGGVEDSREDGSRRECVLAIFWTLLTGMQCFLLTSGLTRRWLAYYSLPSTLLRLLSLQSICWPATSLTLKLVGPSRPLIGWVLIGTTTSLSNTIRIWVTSNIATFPRSAGGGGNGRAHRGTLREALSVANEDIRYASRSLLSIVIGGNGDVADDWDGNAASTAGGGGATGGNGTARAGKTLNKGVVRTKRRMDWRSVIRQVVWPCLTGYWLTAWFLLLERDAFRRMDGRAAGFGY